MMELKAVVQKVEELDLAGFSLASLAYLSAFLTVV